MSIFEFRDETAVELAQIVMQRSDNLRLAAVSSGRVWAVVGAMTGDFERTAIDLKDFFESGFVPVKDEVGYLNACVEGNIGYFKSETISFVRSVLTWRKNLLDAAHRLGVYSIRADDAHAAMGSDPAKATEFAKALDGRTRELTVLVFPNDTVQKLQAELIAAMKVV